jgi:hypothetical protein
MDQLQTRLEALEQQMHTVNRRLRWWRGLACGAVVLAGLTWALPTVIAQEEDAKKGQKGLAQRVAALEKLLKHFSREGKEIFITGANLHIVNGLGITSCTTDQGFPVPDCPNGLGNLIVGYNDPRDGGENIRTGSHNVVLGQRNNFSSFAGLVVGNFNEISGEFAVVSGGQENTASGGFAVVSGGFRSTASGAFAAVSGGEGNVASGPGAAVSGGAGHVASSESSSVSGGNRNRALGRASSVGGGGSFFPDVGNTALGELSSVGGGRGNVASGLASAVSGGLDRTAEGEFDWVAGTLVEDE